MSNVKIMGILNVTPDSFSDGGQFFSADKAIEHGLKMIADGADIIDIGGESTRPGASITAPEEEMRRVVPVIKGLHDQGAIISIDTRNAATMHAALEAGAGMINDISALTHDPESLHIAAAAQVPVVLMHMQGNPQNMQKNPVYKNVVEDVLNYLQERIQACVQTGIKKSFLIADPGFGFGKTVIDNLEILNNLNRFKELDVPVMVGLSRKSFLGRDLPPQERVQASIEAALYARSKGASIFRVHDVAETVKSLKS